jgi:hypothetical protein
MNLQKLWSRRGRPHDAARRRLLASIPVVIAGSSLPTRELLARPPELAPVEGCSPGGLALGYLLYCVGQLGVDVNAPTGRSRTRSRGWGGMTRACDVPPSDRSSYSARIEASLSLGSAIPGDVTTRHQDDTGAGPSPKTRTPRNQGFRGVKW